MCPICGADAPLVVDHDHVSGRVRGRICSKCNSGLGFFQDSPTNLERAAEYLRRPVFENLWADRGAIKDAFNTAGNVTAAAVLLGVSRRTLYRLMERYGIEVKRIVA